MLYPITVSVGDQVKVRTNYDTREFPLVEKVGAKGTVIELYQLDPQGGLNDMIATVEFPDGDIFDYDCELLRKVS